jgi:hypothetical protein
MPSPYNRRREEFCSAGPRGFCGDLRVCSEAQQKAAGPCKRRMALPYRTGIIVPSLLFRQRLSLGLGSKQHGHRA